MVKAVVRALDTVQEFVKERFGGHVDRFGLAGPSKRGWTTWLAGAIDDRVEAFVPIVENLLNINANLHHYWRSLGGWPFAFKDYFDANITNYVDAVNASKLYSIVDPRGYFDRMAAKPKLLISSTNDEFFWVDDSHFFFDALPGEKLLYFPKNTEHQMITGFRSALEAAGGFFDSVFAKTNDRPVLRWKLNSTAGETQLWTDREPEWVRLNYATTHNERRDFRIME